MVGKLYIAASQYWLLVQVNDLFGRKYLQQRTLYTLYLDNYGEVKFNLYTK